MNGQSFDVARVKIGRNPNLGLSGWLGGEAADVRLICPFSKTVHHLYCPRFLTSFSRIKAEELSRPQITSSEVKGRGADWLESGDLRREGQLDLESGDIWRSGQLDRIQFDRADNSTSRLLAGRQIASLSTSPCPASHLSTGVSLFCLKTSPLWPPEISKVREGPILPAPPSEAINGEDLIAPSGKLEATQTTHFFSSDKSLYICNLYRFLIYKMMWTLHQGSSTFYLHIKTLRAQFILHLYLHLPRFTSLTLL